MSRDTGHLRVAWLQNVLFGAMPTASRQANTIAQIGGDARVPSRVAD
jgi:hypothetical protein